VLAVEVTSDDARAAGYVFNVLLIARAPLQLFQAIQGSLLPHLAGWRPRRAGTSSRGRSGSPCSRSPGSPARWRWACSPSAPFAMDLLFEDSYTYARFGLALIAVGMGAHLIAGTLNQAALARDRAGLAAAGWVFSALLFVGWMVSPVIEDPLVRTEVGYAGAALVLCALLTAVYRRPAPSA
jgi:hypothetical protein